MYFFVAKGGKGSHDFRCLLGQLVRGQKDKSRWTTGGLLSLQIALAKNFGAGMSFRLPFYDGGRVPEEVVDTQLSCQSLSSLVLDHNP